MTSTVPSRTNLLKLRDEEVLTVFIWMCCLSKIYYWKKSSMLVIWRTWHWMWRCSFQWLYFTRYLFQTRRFWEWFVHSPAWLRARNVNGSLLLGSSLHKRQKSENWSRRCISWQTIPLRCGNWRNSWLHGTYRLLSWKSLPVVWISLWRRRHGAMVRCAWSWTRPVPHLVGKKAVF